MTDDLMTHSPVTDKPDGHNTMLNDGFMTPLQDVPDKLLCAVFGDLALGLVASSPCLFNQRENVRIRGSIDKLHAGFNNLHSQTPST